ncbi:immune inhibitor A domain-containing protein [Pseudocolwellia agarivorans]|uniref:immune inhibitor A domain-containing protein n=1 Tax=Pseudocolwellia agarivorans TaxID=1911682 RepID=UPI0009846FAD|nr:immune inhibitor A domain-containing protein [Pseudocolwellia agarivorans]
MHKFFKTTLLTSILISSHLSYAESLTNIVTPTDLGVVNKERIAYWLEKRGILFSNATEKEKQDAVNVYLSKRVSANSAFNTFNKKVLGQHQATLKAMSNNSASKSNNQLSKISRPNFAPADVKNTVKVLAIMIDFQDLKHDNHGLSDGDTDMFYNEYPKSHYEDLLFSATGYNGPSNQNIESAYQYYQHESGESLSFTGNTYGWITADNDAKYYGANNNDENDSNVGELVIEAVTKAVAQNQIDLSDYDKTDYFDRDNDGNINEPDGIVDHIMIFHSSIGEESGGGNLGTDAIWSHRFFVFDDNNQPMDIVGSTTKIFGYTITPIDSSTGVVVHEFGHDLGVPDEYDTGNDDIGAPVQAWSVMGSGSWLGSPRGSQPVSFSPYAREYFQTRYEGNWVNQQSVTLTESLNETLTVNRATNHSGGVNQIKINLPNVPEDFGQPFSGTHQYYSGKGDELNNSLSFNASISGSNPILSMKARWDIEQDYDYLVVKVNNQVVAGNYTKATNEFYSQVKNFISGESTNLSGASLPLGWVDLTFNLSNFTNQNVNIEIEYVTDTAEYGYGFVADDIKITSSNGTIFSNGAETLFPLILDGFSRISETVDGAEHYYYVQLRNHSVTDSALKTIDHDPGVLLWYRNEGVENNNVSQHAGEVFIGVVDADQTLIKRNNAIRTTEKQLRDAAFSLYDQTTSTFDTSLTNNAIFNDRDDYSSPLQPESGIKLPTLGLNMEIITQASDSSTATVLLTKNEVSSLVKTQNGLSVSLSIEDDEITDTSIFTWKMGDGTQLTGSSVNHTYQSAGSYNVEVSYTTDSGEKELSKSITVGSPIQGNINLSADNTQLNYSATLTGGQGNFTYRWDFGDNEGVSSLVSGAYTYKNAGAFTVSLTVTDETGESFVFTKSITIDNPLISSFTSSTNNLIASFTSNVAGGSKPYSYLWDFGDSQTDTSATPSHTYATAGAYTVSLTITDADEKTQTVSNNITVSATTTVTNNQNQSSSNSDSGGSMGWFMFSIIGLLGWRKTKLNK